MSTDMVNVQCLDNYYALLLRYAAGNISEAESMSVSAHLTLNPVARSIVADMEEIGAGIIGQYAEPAEINQSVLTTLLDKIDAGQNKDNNQIHKDPEPDASNSEISFLPYPVRYYFETTGKKIAWKNVLKGIDKCPVPVSKKGIAELLKIEPGKDIPSHTHRGEEITLVLEGAFEDETGYYGRGDLIVLDERINHKPVSDAKKGCICLNVSASHIHLTGKWSRFLNFFLK